MKKINNIIYSNPKQAVLPMLIQDYLGRSVSAIKSNMYELVAAGLIEKRRAAKGRANMIFVKVPESCVTDTKLFIIDDLGAERGTEYAVENVFNVIDRILELCIPICVNGASKRTATAKEKMKEMQEILMEVFIEYLTHYQLIVILLIDSGDNMYCGGDNH